MADNVTKYQPTISNMPTPDAWQALPFHKLSTIFPEANEDDYNALCDSIRAHGFLESDPIVLIRDTDSDYEFSILDGRNRYNACTDTKVRPSFVEYVGEDPIGFVTARNMDRRHLSTGQKAAVAAKLATLGMGQNKTSEDDVTQKEAAKRVGVGEATLRRYKAIEEHDPALAEEVAKGAVTLEDARKAVNKEKEGQVVESLHKSTGKLGDKRRKKEEERAKHQTAQLNDLIVDTLNEMGFEGEIRDSMGNIIGKLAHACFKLGKES